MFYFVSGWKYCTRDVSLWYGSLASILWRHLQEAPCLGQFDSTIAHVSIQNGRFGNCVGCICAQTLLDRVNRVFYTAPSRFFIIKTIAVSYWYGWFQFWTSYGWLWRRLFISMKTWLHVSGICQTSIIWSFMSQCCIVLIDRPDPISGRQCGYLQQLLKSAHKFLLSYRA